MITGTLITIREGLEAFLIIGILLGYLTQLRQPKLKTFVWIGAGAAILASVLLAIVFQFFAIEFEGLAEQLYEIGVSLLAVGVLTWMVLWMIRQGHRIKGELEEKVDLALSNRQVFAISGIAFIAVFREGLETVLFITALTIAAGDNRILIEAIFGLIIGAGLLYLLSRSLIHFNLRYFFITTGSLLILIAAGLIGHSVMELQEAGWLSLGNNPAWNMSWFLPDQGGLGELLHALFGYQANPSVLVVVVYALYLVVFGSMFYLGYFGRQNRTQTKTT